MIWRQSIWNWNIFKIIIVVCLHIYMQTYENYYFKDISIPNAHQISVRYFDIDVGLIFQSHWDFLCFDRVVYVMCWRRFQVDTWISMWALYFKCADICFVLTDVVDVVCWRWFQFDTWISMWALYFKGTGIFFVLTELYTSCVEDDFSSILGYRCWPYISKALIFSYWLLKTISGRYLDIDVGLIFQRRWDFLYWLLKTVSVLYWVSTAWPSIWKVLIFSCWTFYCWRRFQLDTWLSTTWPYIRNVLILSCWSFYCCRLFQFDTWFSAVLDYRMLGLILKRFRDLLAGHFTIKYDVSSTHVCWLMALYL